jgi:hypothetical protein|tara:strand:+ start:471 stop:734 length:264 start_codon:yes stop_codon:yes gene_type:complete
MKKFISWEPNRITVETDKEFLETRLDLFSTEAWSLFTQELITMAESLEKINSIEDEKTLFLRRGQVDILNMIINLEETTKLALDQLE